MPGVAIDGPALPNLTRLGKEGIWLPRAYTVNPAPTPSRAVLQTGRYPHAAGVPWDKHRIPEETTGIAAVFAAAGYATAHIGLWQLDGDSDPGFVPPGPRRLGFAEWASWNRGHRYTGGIYFRDENKPVPIEGFEPDGQTSLAVEFLGRRRASPFFLQLSYGPPHPPDPGQVGVPGYESLCASIDKCLGRILGVLDERGLAGDTIVVFAADSGDAHREAWRDSSAGVPLLIRWPGHLPADSRQDWLCATVDLPPTLLGLCGLPPIEAAQGVDRSKLLQSNGVGARPESVFVQGRLGTPAEWRMVVRGWDKLVVDRELKVTHLFNLAQDPREQDNLAVDRATLRRQEELLALMRRWIITAGDRVPYPGRAPEQEQSQ